MIDLLCFLFTPLPYCHVFVLLSCLCLCNCCNLFSCITSFLCYCDVYVYVIVVVCLCVCRCQCLCVCVCFFLGKLIAVKYIYCRYGQENGKSDTIYEKPDAGWILTAQRTRKQIKPFKKINKHSRISYFDKKK